eukprot:gene23077-16933_t
MIALSLRVAALLALRMKYCEAVQTTTDYAGTVYADGTNKAFTPTEIIRRLSAAGFDAILDYSFGQSQASHNFKGPMNWTMVTDYLDGLHAANLSAVYMLNMFSYRDGVNIIEEFVAHTKDHPALFGYDIAEAMGAPGLPNMTKHTNAIKALDPNHIVLRNEGPLDMMTYQSKNDCKFKNSSTHIGGGELDMCYALYFYGHEAWLNASDAWGSQLYPWPVSPE